MYTFFKRTAPDPNLMTFDCPDSNISVTKRNLSNTPIMALATLQNTVFHEAAQAFAKRILSLPEPADDTVRVTTAYRLCLARPPSQRELEVVLALLADNRAYYRENEAPARELAGAFVPAEGTASETAAWVATLRIVTNLDEFITRP